MDDAERFFLMRVIGRRLRGHHEDELAPGTGLVLSERGDGCDEEDQRRGERAREGPLHWGYLLGSRWPRGPGRPPATVDAVTTRKKFEVLQQVSRGLTALSS